MRGLDRLPPSARAALEGSSRLLAYDRALILAMAHVESARGGFDEARPGVYRARLATALDELLASLGPEARAFVAAWEKAGQPCA